MIFNPEEPDDYLLDREYFCIHDDLFDIIQSTHKDKISCGSLYQMNQIKMNLRVKQQRYVMKISKRRKVLLPKNNPSILFI